MRLFIAAYFNPDTTSRLITLRDKLRSRSERGNFSHDGNPYLTLAFLGKCNEKKEAVAKDIMDSMAFEPFKITIDFVGIFKHDDGEVWGASCVSEPPAALMKF